MNEKKLKTNKTMWIALPYNINKQEVPGMKSIFVDGRYFISDKHFILKKQWPTHRQAQICHRYEMNVAFLLVRNVVYGVHLRHCLPILTVAPTFTHAIVHHINNLWPFFVCVLFLGIFLTAFSSPSRSLKLESSHFNIFDLAIHIECIMAICMIFFLLVRDWGGCFFQTSGM